MRSLTLEEVVLTGRPAEASNRDHVQFRYDTFEGDCRALRYFDHGCWLPIHQAVLDIFKAHPALSLIVSGYDVRPVEVPVEGWHHRDGCTCQFCHEGS